MDEKRETPIDTALTDPATPTDLPEKTAVPFTDGKAPNSSPILCLGMARTGTASLTSALSMLGVPRVHHGTETYKKQYDYQWRVVDRACDAAFPVLPSYTGEPFGRAEWDECFGGYGAVSDIASFFAVSLIKAYPDAKVILVERDIDRWLESIKVVFEPWRDPWMRRAVRWISPLAGSHSGPASLKMALGWTESERPEDMMKNARAAYIRHYKEIREMVPPEQLLEFQLKDGWEPLCNFLGKEVPSVPFPHVNDAAAYKKHRKEAEKDIYKRIARRVFLPCLK